MLTQEVLEQRPTLRNQWTSDARDIQYIAGSDAALHVDYRFFHDDWGIDSHTLDLSWYQPLGDGWMVVPGLRYYTQSAADFYKPYFLLNQPFPIKLPRNPELGLNIDFSKLTIHNFSSDERLSGFGSLSARADGPARQLWRALRRYRAGDQRRDPARCFRGQQVERGMASAGGGRCERLSIVERTGTLSVTWDTSILTLKRSR